MGVAAAQRGDGPPPKDEGTIARVCFTVQPGGQPGESLTLGQARTAVYNWLYARHEGGTFVLRFAEPGAVQGLCAELRWLGLDWDESPQVVRARDPAVQRYARQLRKDGGSLLEPGEQLMPPLERVVGDHQMAVTHVIRDARCTPRAEQELQLYRALGWKPPRYIHLPAIESADGAAPDVDTLAAYRARGYLSLALANHLARLGWTPRGKRELLSLEELAARFDLRRVSRSPAAFDLQQLNWFNRRALCALDAQALAALLAPRWQEAYGAAGRAVERAAGTALTPAGWQQALALALREELDDLNRAVERARFAFVDEVTPDREARAVLSQPYAPEVLQAFVRELPTVEPFTYEPIDAWVSDLRQRLKAALAATQGLRSRDVMYVLRAALTGRMDGPCLVEVCQLLGRQRCATRALAVNGVLQQGCCNVP